MLGTIDFIAKNTHTKQCQIDWLKTLLSDFQLLSDLSRSDLVLWVKTKDENFIAAGQVRPATASSLFYRDLVGQKVRQQWEEYVIKAYTESKRTNGATPDWFDEIPTQVTMIPIACPREIPHQKDTPLAIFTRHTYLAGSRSRTRQEIAFSQCAEDLFLMIESGTFALGDTPPLPASISPRAHDGLTCLNEAGVVTFASANALSIFNKMGFRGELEGEVLSEVIKDLYASSETVTANEALPIIASGRAAWGCSISIGRTNITLRSIPLTTQNTERWSIVLCRDTTGFYSRQQEMITKDAIIREVHHRVKNNLQTVAALLRVQSRRAESKKAKLALDQATKRVSAIALVHDTLSGGLAQEVYFDEVFLRVIKLACEVATAESRKIRPIVCGRFESIPSEFATPLALALTEIISNAAEHAFTGSKQLQVYNKIIVNVLHTEKTLKVYVEDNGIGIPNDILSEGLGMRIVKTLVVGELGGTIEWKNKPEGGCLVCLEIPKNWVTNQPTPINTFKDSSDSTQSLAL